MNARKPSPGFRDQYRSAPAFVRVGAPIVLLLLVIALLGSALPSTKTTPPAPATSLTTAQVTCGRGTRETGHVCLADATKTRVVVHTHTVTTTVTITTPAPRPAPAPSPATSTSPAQSSPTIETVGSSDHSTDAEFCAANTCIGNFTGESGTIVECSDGTYSHAGGIGGACSSHGGEM
jgi:hypothetical protein